MSNNEITLITEETRNKIINLKNEKERKEIIRKTYFKTAELLKKRKLNTEYINNNPINGQWKYKQKENKEIAKELKNQYEILCSVINYNLSFKDFICKVAEALR